MRNLTLLALVGLLLAGAVIWIVRSRSDAGGESRSFIPAARPAGARTPSVNPEPAGVLDGVDPDDVDPKLVERFAAQAAEDGLGALIAKMSWCGTDGANDPAVEVDPLCGVEGSGPIRVRVEDVVLRRLRDELTDVKVPSKRRELVRAFLVDRNRLVSAKDAADLMESLADAERYSVLRDRLERAAAALRDGASWEKAFDAAPLGRPSPPPKSR